MAVPVIKLDSKSLDKAKPGDLKAAKLSSAIKSAEKALDDEKKKKDDPKAIESCMAAIQAAATAASDTIKKECDKKKHKDFITALKKFDSTCQTEIKRLQDAIKGAADGAGDDDDVNDAELFGIKLFKECIKKAKLKSSPDDGVSFCFAVHKKAENCKLVMMKKKKFAGQTFKRVYKLSKDDPSLGFQRAKMAFGYGYKPADNKETLVLHLDDKSPSDIPGMVRKLEKWRKINKQDILPFKQIEFRSSNGQPLVETPDLDEEEEIATSTQATQEQGQAAPDGAQQQADAPPADGQPTDGQPADQQPGDQQPADQASPAPTDLADDKAIEDRRKQFKKARRQWQSVKEKAIQDLEAVKDGIRDYYLDDPEQFKVATGKLGQLDSIMDNLNDDLRDVLDQYVSTPKNRLGDLDRLGGQATQIVEKFLNFASKDKLLNAVDEKEFADVSVKEPIEKALKDLVKTLA